VSTAGAKGPDDHGCFDLNFNDGGSADLFAHNLETSCMVAVYRHSPKLTNFLFELLCAGNWVMLPVTEKQ